ncbi:MAG: PIN domain-containing protein [bacterium]
MYVFDTSVFIVISRSYFKDSFRTFWDRFDNYLDDEKIISVREVKLELESYQGEKFNYIKWCRERESIFQVPTSEEAEFVREIFKINRFSELISRKSVLKGTPVADPFVIAKAKIKKFVVVTQEEYKPNAAKIPNVCKHFEIDCIGLEDFLKNEKWQF